MNQRDSWRYVVLASAVAGVGALLSAAGQPQPQPQALALASGAPIERHLDRAGSDRYQVTLAAGEAVNVEIEQRGLDVVVQVVGPDNTPIVEFQDDFNPHG